MSKRAKQKLFNSCMAAAIVLTSTIAPVVVNAATPNVAGPVTRLGGFDQYATAALIAQKGWSGTSDNVVLSAGMNYSLVDALAAGPLATSLKAPILLTDDGQTLNPAAKAELLRLKPKKVFITSGTAVIKQSVINEIQAMGITPVQLGGFDQYETSVNIAKEMALQGVDISRVMLAAGWLTPADALSVSSIAAAQGIPILTTTQGALPQSVKTYLDSIKATVTESLIVGGTAVVSDAVKAELPGQVSRYSGLTKYDTNLQILKSFAKDYKNDKVYVANGETLVDALAGIPLAAADRSPVVLVHQQLDNTTKEFVKLNLSTTDMVVLGGEFVVPTAGMNALTSNIAYATNGVTEGSTTTTQPQKLTDNLLVTGDNVTLQNIEADYSVYVKGNNISLNNLTVKGTVFVDPGDTGSVTLNEVTAANIVILSGASDTIHLKNTIARVLTVDSSSSNVHVEATGKTKIGNTVVRSFAILDANGGLMGEITISSTPGQSPAVELRGTFTDPIIVTGPATLIAATGAVVPNIVINTVKPGELVTLDGNFESVEVQSTGEIVLAADTVVETMDATAVKTEITIPSGSSIGSLESGSTGTLVSGGGDVNGEETNTTPSIPATPPTPPSTGGGGGGGGGGGTTEVSKTVLSNSINTAVALLATKTVGTAAGNISLAAKNAFQAAITAATAVNANANATQAEVNAQVLALTTATTALANAVIPPSSTESQFIDKLMEVHSELTPAEKTTLNTASANLLALSASDPAWDDIVEPLLSAQVEAHYLTREAAIEALAQFLTDYSNLYYSADRAALEGNLETFRNENRETFRTLFGDDFTMEQFYSFLIATQEALPGVISSSSELLNVISGSNSDIKDQMVVWTKETMHQVADATGSEYGMFSTKLADIGLNTNDLVEAQRRLGAEVDSTNAAEKAIVMAAIRSQIICSVPTLNVSQTHVISISVKDLDTGSLNLASVLDWYSSNEAVATINGTTITTHSAGTTILTAVKSNTAPGIGNELVYCTVTVN